MRHPSSARFHELLAEIGELHDLKQNDYGTDNDPFANVRGSTAFGIPGWVGALVRANDKIKRLQTLSLTGRLSNEGAVDSFKDLAVYALIGLVLFEEENGREDELLEEVPEVPYSDLKEFYVALLPEFQRGLKATDPINSILPGDYVRVKDGLLTDLQDRVYKVIRIDENEGLTPAFPIVASNQEYTTMRFRYDEVELV